ncbi:MAG: helix-turn-helix domain-containing protein [Gemmatimonadaceae bacterium]
MSKPPDSTGSTRLPPGAIGRVLMATRRALGMSQAELAGQIGVTRQSVIAMEKGSPGLSIGTILRALGVLGLTIEVKPPDDVAPLTRQDVIGEAPAASQSPVNRPNEQAAHSPAPAMSFVPDIDRIIEDAQSGTRFPLLHQPLPNRARKRKAGDAA